MTRNKAVLAGILLAVAVVPCVKAKAKVPASVENPVLTRLTALRASRISPDASGHWVQPSNRTEPCKLYMWGTPDPATKSEWLGDCSAGKAFGIGVIVSESPQGKAASLEEYPGGDGSDTVTLRQSFVSAQGKGFMKGRITPATRVVNMVTTGLTAKGNPAVGVADQSCRDGECTVRAIDPQTGSISYVLSGTNGYSISWIDQRADNQALFTRRFVWMDGTTPIEKFTFDGAVYDIYNDTHSGQRGRTVFNEQTNAVLALPLESFAAISSDVQSAVRESDAKFASVYERFCRAQKNQTIRLLCDPSALFPEDSLLGPARAEFNEAARTTYAQLRNNAATANALLQQQQLAAGQQALAAEQQRQANQAALRETFESINRASQDSMRQTQELMQTYTAPQVQHVEGPTLSRPPIVHCRTIGYITTCN
jgi:hypothetical protein